MAGVFYMPLVGTPTAEGNLLSFYVAGTSTPLDVWTDSDLTIAWAQPIVLNADGESMGPIYVSASPSYKVVYTDSTGAAIAGYPVDSVSPSTIVAAWSGLRTMITVTQPLTDAQIKLLPTTPFTLVAAPSGLRIKVLNATIRTSFAAGAYTNFNMTYSAIALYYLGNFNVWATVGAINDSTPTSGAITQLRDAFSTTPKLFDLPPYVDTPSFVAKVQWTLAPAHVTADANGIALAIAIDNNGSGALTGGNVANSMSVTVYYIIESVQ